MDSDHLTHPYTYGVHHHLNPNGYTDLHSYSHPHSDHTP
jgi:hypothetical protein